jgi:lipoprotein-releasing system permease protein
MLSALLLKTFLKKDLLSRRSRAALKWMNIFAFVAVALAVFSWATVMSIMGGLQKDILDKNLRAKPHLLWEDVPRVLNLSELPTDISSQIISVKKTLQSEALMEVPRNETDDNSLRSGVIIQGDDSIPEGAVDLASDLASQVSILNFDQVIFRSAWKLDVPPLKLRVRKIFTTGVYELDRALVRVSPKDLEQWLGLVGFSSRLEVKLKDPFNSIKLRKSLEEKYGLTLKVWQELDSALWYSLRLEKFAMGFALFCMVLLASLAVNMALSVRVSEKVREISLLRSMGLTRKDIFRLYILEGFFIGTLSSVLGAIGAYYFSKVLSQYLSFPDIYYSTAIPVSWSHLQVAFLVFMSILLCLWASWNPARRAMSVDIAQGLRF